MKIEELKELTNDELKVRQREYKEELLHLRIQQQSGQLENSSRIRLVRRAIARIETIYSERRISAAAAPTES